MVKEMTHGKPLPLILGFCLPMLLGNLFQQLYSMVDAIIVGQFLDIDALAAVGSTGAVSFFVLGFAVGITGGAGILPSQCFGAGDYSQMRKYIANAIYLCIITSVVVTSLAVGLCYPLLRLMQTPDDVIDLAYDYIVVIFWGIGITMAYNLMAGILRAMGDSKSPLYFLIVASIMNIGLDLLFIVVFGAGVAGAGWATVISQAFSAFLCFIYIKKNFPILAFEKGDMAFSKERIWKVAKLGIPMGLQFSITAIGTIILQGAVNGLGKTAMAAVTAAGKIQAILVTPMETLGITMATYSAQNLGAGKYRRITRGMNCGFASELIYSAAAMAIGWFLSEYICLLFVNAQEKEVIDQAVYFIRINTYFYPALALLFITRNSLQGLGYSLLPMLAGASELIARTAVVIIFISPFGFDAACYASPVAWVAAAILLLIIYKVKIGEVRRRLTAEKSA